MAMRYHNIEISHRDGKVESLNIFSYMKLLVMVIGTVFDSIIGITWINLHVQYYCQTTQFFLIRPYFLP